MKLLHACILAFVTLSLAKAEECPRFISEKCPEFESQSPITLPCPEDFSKFCQCSEGVAVLMTCPPGTVFMTDILTCDMIDYEARSFASGSPLSTYTTVGSGECSADISDMCPDVDPPIPVFIEDPDDCSKFCECSGGTAISFDCQNGTLWNQEDLACEFPSDVECGTRPNPYETLTPSGTQTPIPGACSNAITSQCPDVDPPIPIYIADPDDCSKYCQCAGGTAYANQCPGELLWSEDDTACELEQNVDCGTRTNPYETLTTGYTTFGPPGQQNN